MLLVLNQTTCKSMKETNLNFHDALWYKNYYLLHVVKRGDYLMHQSRLCYVLGSSAEWTKYLNNASNLI